MSKPEGLPEMEYRLLGRSGLKVSAISLGGWLTYGGHIDRGKFDHALGVRAQDANNLSKEGTFAWKLYTTAALTSLTAPKDV
jgi:hypothetical protein